MYTETAMINLNLHRREWLTEVKLNYDLYTCMS